MNSTACGRQAAGRKTEAAAAAFVPPGLLGARLRCANDRSMQSGACLSPGCASRGPLHAPARPAKRRPGLLGALRTLIVVSPRHRALLLQPPALGESVDPAEDDREAFTAFETSSSGSAIVQSLMQVLECVPGRKAPPFSGMGRRWRRQLGLAPLPFRAALRA